MRPIPIPPPTPELDKMRAVKHESQPIGEFLEWLRQDGILLCRYEHERCDELCPITTSEEKLLARYYEIDLAQVEEERSALLDYQRALNEEDDDS